jgi:hypothetical protein
MASLNQRSGLNDVLSNSPQKVKSFLSVNNDTEILGIKHSKTCCIIDLSIFYVAKSGRSARESIVFLFSPKCSITKLASHLERNSLGP